MKLTKMDMAKVIVTALYDLPAIVVPKNTTAWCRCLKLVKLKKEDLRPQYDSAYEILSRREHS